MHNNRIGYSISLWLTSVLEETEQRQDFTQIGKAEIMFCFSQN